MIKNILSARKKPRRGNCLVYKGTFLFLCQGLNAFTDLSKIPPFKLGWARQENGKNSNFWGKNLNQPVKEKHPTHSAISKGKMQGMGEGEYRLHGALGAELFLEWSSRKTDLYRRTRNSIGSATHLGMQMLPYCFKLTLHLTHGRLMDMYIKIVNAWEVGGVINCWTRSVFERFKYCGYALALDGNDLVVNLTRTTPCLCVVETLELFLKTDP